jgi:pimeloyl-ACP methyl ester carboxylesterase
MQSPNNTLFFENGFSDVNGIKMYYEIHGEGKPLVLIHGGGSTIQTSFGKMLPLFAKHRKVIAVELQAHGHTQDRNTPLSFKQDAEDVVTLLENLKVSRTDILGFSNGGQTAMQIAITFPDVVNKLIIASAFYKRSDIADQFWEGMNQAKLSDMPEALKDEHKKINNDAAKLLNMFERDVQRMQTFKGWTENEIRGISCPTLLIAGDRDIISPEKTVAMCELIPGCRLAIIPGAHGEYLGEITTLNNESWDQEYVINLFEQFLNQGR